MRWLALVAALVAGIAFGGLTIEAWHRYDRRSIGTVGTLESVILTNNQIYFGTLDAVEPDGIVLRNVFYLATSTDPKANRLVNRRTNDAHGPSRMWIPRERIALVEDVGPDSQIGKLMTETGSAK